MWLCCGPNEKLTGLNPIVAEIENGIWWAGVRFDDRQNENKLMVRGFETGNFNFDVANQNACNGDYEDFSEWGYIFHDGCVLVVLYKNIWAT